MNETNKTTNIVKSLCQEIPRAEAEQMRATIEQQTAEIEQLHKDYDESCEDAMCVARELAALAGKEGE